MSYIVSYSILMSLPVIVIKNYDTVPFALHFMVTEAE